MRCAIDCPYRGKCDLELKDADACATWRVNQPQAIRRIYIADKNKIYKAKKADVDNPIQEVEYLRKAAEVANELPFWLGVKLIESRRAAIR